MRHLKQALTITLAAGALAACDDISGTDINGTSSGTLSFAVAEQPSNAQPASMPAGMSAVPITDSAGRTLDITKVQVVLEEVELKRAEHGQCAEDDDACEYFEIGPVLVDLPAGGGVITPFDVPIPAGTYEELELEIDEAGDDDSTSAQFFSANPTWPQEASIRVVGTFDANDGAGPQPFDVYLDVDAEIERELVPPLVVTDSTQDVNVTVEIDVAAWFMGASGLIDPRELAANEDLVDQLEDTIEDSFEAYEDDDHDGDDDDADNDGIDDEDEDGGDDEDLGAGQEIGGAQSGLNIQAATRS